jgi:hypothetical protein
MEDYEDIEEIEEFEEDEEEGEEGLDQLDEFKLNKYQKKLLDGSSVPDYSKIKFNENIKMKKFNEHGMRNEDGYDYS